ncbi:hypothetical protein JD969_17300 [Planctomycetota bacterium]|nr:hypothetical protein JD969_17300 [Planctomycetota bacterium]
MSSVLFTLAQDFAPVADRAHASAPLTLIGWVIMIFALGGVSILLGWCIYKVVTVNHPEEHLHTQADITPPDELEERQ